MNNIKKLLTISFMVFALAFMPITNSFAFNGVSTNELGNASIKLGLIKVDTDYKEDEIYVEYNDNDTFVEATIFNSKTNEKLESYKEYPGKTRPSAKDDNLIYRSLDMIKYIGPGKIEVATEVEIYANGSFRQINAVESYDQDLVNYYTRLYLEDDSMYLTTRDFPTKRIRFTLRGTLVTANSYSGGGSLSYDKLEGYNFSINGSRSGTWYARLRYKKSATFSVY